MASIVSSYNRNAVHLARFYEFAIAFSNYRRSWLRNISNLLDSALAPDHIGLRKVRTSDSGAGLHLSGNLFITFSIIRGRLQRDMWQPCKVLLLAIITMTDQQIQAALHCSIRELANMIASIRGINFAMPISRSHDNFSFLLNREGITNSL
jgi:hypothetical protein